MHFLSRASTTRSLLARLPVFFILLLFATLTSSISILEIFVPYVIETFPQKFDRKKASILGSVICMVLAIPVSFSFGIWGDVRILGVDIFTLYDNFIVFFAYPLIAMFTAILVGWVWGKKNAMNAITNNGTLKSNLGEIWVFLVKYIIPGFLLIIVLTGLTYSGNKRGNILSRKADIQLNKRFNGRPAESPSVYLSGVCSLEKEVIIGRAFLDTVEWTHSSLAVFEEMFCQL